MNITPQLRHHPSTLTALHTLQPSFFSTLSQIGSTNCSHCGRSIAFSTHITVKDHRTCVGCLGKSFQRRQPYTIISYGLKSKSLRRLAMEFQLLKAVEKVGVDNIQLIRQELNMRVGQDEIRMFIRGLARKSAVRKNKKQQREPDELGGEVKNGMIELQDTRASLQDNKVRSDNGLSQRHQKEYQFSDHLLASLHQQTDDNTVHFLTNFKISQMNQNLQIQDNIKQILQSLNKAPQQILLQNTQASQTITYLSKETEIKDRARNITIKAIREQQILLHFKALTGKCNSIHPRKQIHKKDPTKFKAKPNNSSLIKAKLINGVQINNRKGQMTKNSSSHRPKYVGTSLSCGNIKIKDGTICRKIKMIKKVNAGKSVHSF